MNEVEQPPSAVVTAHSLRLSLAPSLPRSVSPNPVSDLTVKDQSVTNDGAAFAWPTDDEVREVIFAKYGRPEEMGPGPRLRYRFGYATPDDHYEALVAKLVTLGCHWLDVGCGHDIFPTNQKLAEALTERCGFLMGIDPSHNIHHNPYLDEREQTTIEATRTDHTFDLVTLRMVAEHIADPQAALSRLADLTKPGGVVVVYTVDRWSLTALTARLLPHRLHHPIKRFLWRTEERDTFPVAYRLNTWRTLRRALGKQGFGEVGFRHLDDCRTLHRFPRLHRLELSFWAACSWLGRRHADNCLLGVYERR